MLKNLIVLKNYKKSSKLFVCGENLFAVHSIRYNNLEAYFQVFSIWEKNVCLHWNDTVSWCEYLSLIPVKEIYRGIYKEEEIKEAFIPYKDEHEGYVIRLTSSFLYKNFNRCVVKYVRKNHVQGNEFWMNKKFEKNKLKI